MEKEFVALRIVKIKEFTKHANDHLTKMNRKDRELFEMAFEKNIPCTLAG